MTGPRSSRRGSSAWALPADLGTAMDVDVLIPTVGRIAELAVTLAGLAAQDAPRFRVLIADQSGDLDDGRSAGARRATGDAGVASSPAVSAMMRVLTAQGRPVRVHGRRARNGVAEQRQHLLEAATARYVLFLDDDVWLEPGALSRMHEAITTLGCGFVGQAVQGLSYLDDRRPDERAPFELWDGEVRPERVRPGTPEYERWPLHNAANVTHLAADLGLAAGEWRAYRIAWLGGCTLYERAALLEAGGFAFWPSLAATHAGEDVVAQWRVMERVGGAGIIPSGAVHLEAPTTIADRTANAVDVLYGKSDPSA